MQIELVPSNKLMKQLGLDKPLSPVFV